MPQPGTMKLGQGPRPRAGWGLQSRLPSPWTADRPLFIRETEQVLVCPQSPHHL